jgi:hypothetical protein
MVPPSNTRKVLTPTQVSDAGAAAQKTQPPQLPTLKQAQTEEMMNPQHRPLTQELVQMAMAKTAEHVALIEESERQRGLPTTTTKVASDETDESIGTDFAEKLASAVEFILPEVQAKEAAGMLDTAKNLGQRVQSFGHEFAGTRGKELKRIKETVSQIGHRVSGADKIELDGRIGAAAAKTRAARALVGKGSALVGGGALLGAGATHAAKKEAGALDAVGGAVRSGAASLASRAGSGALGRGAMAVGGHMAGLTNSQIGGRALATAGGGLLAAGGTAAALHHGRDKQAAGRFSAAVDVVKGVAGKGKEKVMNAAGATADLLKNKRGKELAAEARDLGSKAKARSVTANMNQVPKKWREEAASDAVDLASRAGKAKKDSTIATVKSHAAKGALGLTGVAATGLAGKKIHDKVKEAAALPASFKANAAKVKDAFSSGAGKAKDAVVGAASKGKEKARAAADATGDALVKHRGKAVAAGVVAGAGLAYGAKKIHDKSSEKKAGMFNPFGLDMAVAAAIGANAGAHKSRTGRVGEGAARGAAGAALGAGAGKIVGHTVGGTSGNVVGTIGGGILGYQLATQGLGKKHAEDAINPAHISGKASPLAAAPTRTETGQDGPSPQGNTGALSSNAAAIAFSNAKNQGMKAEQLRKYFSNPASSQHGDPALTKNFAHKTASDKVAEAQHILSALAAQVEGK